MKKFFKYFLIAFAVFLIMGTSVRGMLQSVAETKVFVQPEEEINLETIVDENSPFFQNFKDANRVNVLLVGMNTGLTDTIMLVSFDIDKKHVDVISLPRDTYYPRSKNGGQAEAKLNAAYHDNKIMGTAKAVSDLLMGMPINYYAIIDYDGIAKIVDSMGGVPMDIPFRMKYTDKYDKPPLYIDIPEGQQTLNGEDAVKFLRFRKASRGYEYYLDGDIGRIKAQQQFVKSAFKQALGFNLPKVAGTVFENVESNVDIGTMLSLATKAVGISKDAIETYTLPGTPQSEAPWYWYPDTEKTEEMITQIYNIQTTSNGAVINTSEGGVDADADSGDTAQ